MKKLLFAISILFIGCTPEEQYQEPKISCDEIRLVYAQKLSELLKFQNTMPKETFNEFYNQYVTEREKLLKENNCN